MEQEFDGVGSRMSPDLLGVLVHGQSREEAIRKAQALSLRVRADRLEHGEPLPEVENVFSIVA
jgi:predicted RNase H-like HicB family nuclease